MKLLKWAARKISLPSDYVGTNMLTVLSLLLISGFIANGSAMRAGYAYVVDYLRTLSSSTAIGNGNSTTHKGFLPMKYFSILSIIAIALTRDADHRTPRKFEFEIDFTHSGTIICFLIKAEILCGIIETVQMIFFPTTFLNMMLLEKCRLACKPSCEVIATYLFIIWQQYGKSLLGSRRHR